MLEEKFSRGEFLSVVAGLGLCSSSFLPLVADEIAKLPVKRSLLAVASGTDPKTMVTSALNALGGIERFVKRGNTVVVKPNAAWARTPEQAANTNPEVVKAIIQLCYQAGAKKVIVPEHSCDNCMISFEKSGVKRAAESAGAKMYSADDRKHYAWVDIPQGRVLKKDFVVKDVLNADVFINVPVAKVHGASAVTLSMKNMMGIIWDRSYWHMKDLDQCIADFSSRIKANLIILDATRILLTRGPKGPGEVKQTNQIIAGTDPVAVDAYGAKLLGKEPKEIKHIKIANQMGIGEIDLKKVRIKKV